MKPINYRKYVPEMKRRTVNLDLLFNTKMKNKDTQATAFHVRNTVAIKKGNTAFASVTCNGVPMTCNAGTDVTITANYPMGANEVFADCSFMDVSDEAKADIVAATVENWALTEATFAYSTFTGTDLTTEVIALNAANTYEEIAYLVKQLTSRGYAKKDIIVAIEEGVGIDLAALDLGCCDLAVKTSDEKSVAAKKLGIKEIVEVPADVLSGNITGAVLTPATTIKIRAYVPELHPLLDYCKKDLRIEEFSSDENSNDVRIYGKEYLGAGEIQAGDSEVHAFFADTIVV